MNKSKYFSYFAVILVHLFAFQVEASWPLYCKCTCFGNSSLIKIEENDISGLSERTSFFLTSHSKREDTDIVEGCSKCTRQFCLDYNLPICKSATDGDITAECIRRESMKELLIISLFMILTVFLVIYAAVNHYILKRQSTMS